ncbi:cation:proton antiporter regulatory subunit, partial [Bacillus cereus]
KPSKFSTSSSFFTVLSKYSSKNARPTAAIKPTTKAIATFNIGLNIVAIKRGKEVIVSPRATENIQAGDILIVIGHDDEVDRF